MPKRDLLVDHERRQDFRVAVLRGVQVEHEADEGALEAGTCAHVDGKTRAGELGGAFEIEDAEGFAELPVGLGGESRRSGLSPQVLTVTLSASDWPAGTSSRVRLGMPASRLAQLLVERCGGLVELVEFVSSGRGSRPSAAALVLAGFFERADLLARDSLRRALDCSARVMASRRVWSRARKSPSSAAGSAPRARSFSSTIPGWRGQIPSRASLFQFTRLVWSGIDWRCRGLLSPFARKKAKGLEHGAFVTEISAKLPPLRMTAFYWSLRMRNLSESDGAVCWSGVDLVLPAGEALVAGDEAGAAGEGEVGPDPGGEDGRGGCGSR